MSLGVNKDYKTRDRLIAVALKYHREKMQSYMDTGMDKSNASEKAFRDYKDLTPKETRKLLRQWKEKHW